MIFAIDVYYPETGAKAVGVLFNWNDTTARETIITYIPEAGGYEPGAFYKRELPAIAALLNEIDLTTVDAILVDGHIYVDNNGAYGLGGHTWKLLGEKIPVIGVAKRGFYANKETVIEVFRGESGNPLHVSAIGMDTAEAAQFVKDMHGKYRIPDILKKLDMVTKE